MVYREPAPKPPRAARVFVLELRRRGPAWRVLTFVLVAGSLAAAAITSFVSTDVVCVRARGDVVCDVTDRVMLESTHRRFVRRPPALAWSEVETTDDSTTIFLTVDGDLMRGSSTSVELATNVVRDYERFLADERAPRFERSVGPRIWRFAWPAALIFATLMVLVQGSVDQRTVLTLDFDEDRLRVQTRGWFARAPTVELDWTEVTRLEARDPDRDENDVLDVFAVVGRDDRRLCTARDFEARRVVETINGRMKTERDRRDEAKR